MCGCVVQLCRIKLTKNSRSGMMLQKSLSSIDRNELLHIRNSLLTTFLDYRSIFVT